MFSNKAELGWDSKVEHRYDETNKKRLYTFTVNKKRYFSSTSDLLVDVKAAGLYTTGTRIFRVYEDSDMDKKKTTLILKDYWPATVYDTEVDIRSKLLADITDPKERCLVKMTLLTPTRHENVDCKKPRDTERTILRGKSPSLIYKFEVPDSVFGRKDNVNGHPQEMSKKSAVNRCSSILHRKHCRIVYKENATPYSRIDNIKDMLLVLENSINGIFYSVTLLTIF